MKPGKLPGKRWVAAQRVAEAALARRAALLSVIPETFAYREFIKLSTHHEQALNAALNAWLAAGGADDA